MTATPDPRDRAIPLAAWLEMALDGCFLLLPPVLAIAPHGAAPLAAVAALFGVGLVVATRGDRRLAPLLSPAILLGMLLLWGGLSAAWSIDPWRSLMIDARLAGLFAAGLALAAAASRIAAPWRLALALGAGSAIAIVLAGCDLASGGELSRYVSVRPFIAPRFDPLAAWLALLLLPAGAFLICRGRKLLGLAVVAAIAAAVFHLVDTTAKIGLAASLPIAVLFHFRPAGVARVGAAVSVIVILTAPLTLPSAARVPRVFAAVDAYKSSAGHRLLIWSFAGDRIAERPFLGWGLDSARAMPGGKDEIRPGQDWLPLHPHDAALQVWLELGAPGAALFALLLGGLWLRLGRVRWPPLYAAAAAGSFAAALAPALASWGMWEEWWLATLAMALAAMLALAPEAAAAERRAG
jgi:exopolysaccharide production protein ExoQ